MNTKKTASKNNKEKDQQTSKHHTNGNHYTISHARTHTDTRQKMFKKNKENNEKTKNSNLR